MSTPVRLSGVGASAGAAVGRAFPIDRRRVQEPRLHVAADHVQAEIARLQDAIRRSDQQLELILGKLEGQPQEHALIIEAHRLMLSDPALVDGAEALIRGEQINAEWAVRRVVKQLRSAFDQIDDPYFRDRRNDVDFIGDRLVRNLLGHFADLDARPPDNAIVVAHDLSPADAMLLLNGSRIGGIITEEGSRTSHTAIVARALEVPAVLGVARASELVGRDDLIALDGSAGLVVVHPTEGDIRGFLDVQRRHREHEREALATRELEAVTTDGHRVKLRANIELVEEVPSIIAHGADGIGLYRTEFLYLNRKDLPSEEEHFETYRRLLEAMQGREVTVRTFDLGGEKNMPGVEPKHEPNPQLGLRAIRYCLAHPQMFLSQLRALWRASVFGELRVMLPLVSGVDELRRARSLFEQARAQVVAQGHEVADRLPLGIMVETPAAVMMADELSREAAFFSIGTNDLVQYAIAIDRGNPDVSYLYNPMHPAILRMLLHVIEVGRKAGIPVSICGEMAGEPGYTLVLLALGIEELSMVGTNIPTVKQIIRSASSTDALDLLERALREESPEAAERVVREEMVRRYPDVFPAAH